MYGDGEIVAAKTRLLTSLLGPRDETETRRQGGRPAFTCPLCGHARILRPDFSVGTWYCQHCHLGGNSFQLRAMLEGVSQADAFKATMLEYTSNADQRPETPAPAEPQRKHVNGPAPGWAERCQQYLTECMTRFNGSLAADYLAQRGITADTAHRFKAGFDQAAMKYTAPGGNLKYGAAGLTLPFSPRLDYFAVRMLTPKPEKGIQRWCCPSVTSAGEKPVFNAKALNTYPVVVIVEGAIDALAFAQAASMVGVNIGVVALMGTSCGALVRQLLQCPSASTLVFLMDNDEAGRSALPSIAAQMETVKRSSFYMLDSAAILMDCKDVGDLVGKYGSDAGWMGALVDAVQAPDFRIAPERLKMPL